MNRKEQITRAALHKMLFFITMVASLLLYSGCRNINLDPPDPVEAKTYLRLPTAFLEFCGANFEGVENVQLDWSVDGLDDNLQPYNIERGRFELSNDDFTLSSDLVGGDLEIEVPSSGTYTVSVEIELTCSSCCGTMFDGDLDRGCDGPPRAGEPIFSGRKLLVNQESQPPYIDITPLFDTCFECGCAD